MNCTEIKTLLSGYIDNTLNRQEKATVEEHIRSCPVCAEELAELEAYLERIGSLDRMETPPDFLDRVHERLERRFSFKKVLLHVPVPARFGFPLEAAAVAAAAVLVVFLLTLSPAPDQPLPRPSSVPEISRVGRMVAAMERRAAAPEAHPEYRPVDIEEGGEENIIKLALLVGPERAEGGEMPRPEAPLPMLRAKRAMGYMATAVEDEKEEADEPSTLTRLKNLVTRLGGSILSMTEEAGAPQRMMVEIPPGRYRLFLNELRRIGEIKPPEIPGTGTGEMPVRCRIQIEYQN